MNKDTSKNMNMLSIVGGWLKDYRRLYPCKSYRKNLKDFVVVSKMFFDKKIISYYESQESQESQEWYESDINIFNKYSNWESQWLPFVSSYYLTYTLW